MANKTEVAQSCETQLQHEEKSNPGSRLNGLSIKPFRQLAIEGRDTPELRKIWGNYILEGNTVLFPSERGVGKTFLALQIAMAVSMNIPPFLGEEIQLHGNVLYLNLELGELILKKRLEKLHSHLDLSEGSPYEAISLTTNKSISAFQGELEDLIEKHKPVLVIIDNLRFAFSERDNERNKEMTNVIKKLNEIRDRHHYALLLIHHTKKGSSIQRTNSDLQSGAGAITDLVDSDFFLRKSLSDSNLRILKREKSRNCEEQEYGKLLRLNPETLWFEVVSDQVDERDHIFPQDSPRAQKVAQLGEARKLRNEGKSCQEIGEQLGVNKSTVSRWLKEKE